MNNQDKKPCDVKFEESILVGILNNVGYTVYANDVVGVEAVELKRKEEN